MKEKLSTPFLLVPKLAAWEPIRANPPFPSTSKQALICGSVRGLALTSRRPRLAGAM